VATDKRVRKENKTKMKVVVNQLQSSTFRASWSIITLCGLMSLCMMPWLWQYSNACKQLLHVLQLITVTAHLCYHSPLHAINHSQLFARKLYKGSTC